MTGPWGVLLALLLAGQDTSLAGAAESLRGAWARHDEVALLATARRLVVQLPGAEPSSALEREQARALLREFLASGEEEATLLRAARATGERRGYVELQRRYRVRGTQAVRVQSVLLSLVRGEGGWELVELRVIG